MRAFATVTFLTLFAGCSSTAPSTEPVKPAPPVEEVKPAEPEVPRDIALYKNDYQWPAEWTEAKDEAGKGIHNARVAKTFNDRQLIVVDSASALFGHKDQMKRTVVAFGSHCGMNVAELVNEVKPLGVIGNDAGIGLHSAGVICVSYGDKEGIPAATVSADTAYMGVALSLWDTGKVSLVNKSAEALGVKVGMSAQEAADIMLTKGTPRP